MKVACSEIRNEYILSYMLQNPGASRKEIAAYFNVTPTWISIVTRSDAFRSRMAEILGESVVVAATETRASLEALADIAIERLAEKVEVSQDPEFLRKTTDMALHRLGYAPVSSKAPGANVQVNLLVGREDLQAAREQILNVSLQAGDKALEGRQEENARAIAPPGELEEEPATGVAFPAREVGSGGSGHSPRVLPYIGEQP